jgi:hypothetical protein
MRKKSGAQGPVTTFIDVLEALTADVVGLDRTDILNIAPEIFQDGNKESGLFYYHPQSYNLAWTADGGYGMRMLYGAAREVGASGEVVMTARLDARVGVTDAQLIRRLMEAHVKRNPGITFRELRPMPLKEPPAVSLSYGLTSLYEIPTERIVTTQLSDALASIDIAFATDAITIENLQMLLKENVGINGKVVFAPASKTVASREIPLEINIASPQTFGVFPLDQGNDLEKRDTLSADTQILACLDPQGRPTACIFVGPGQHPVRQRGRCPHPSRCYSCVVRQVCASVLD